MPVYGSDYSHYGTSGLSSFSYSSFLLLGRSGVGGGYTGSSGLSSAGNYYGGGRNRYSPLLPTIIESPTIPRRVPRTTPVSYNLPPTVYSPRTTPTYHVARPVNVDTENIDVSTPRTPIRPQQTETTEPSHRSTIKRGRTVVRIHTKHLKENPSERKNRMTPGERLKEKFLIRDVSDAERRRRIEEDIKLRELERQEAEKRWRRLMLLDIPASKDIDLIPVTPQVKTVTEDLQTTHMPVEDDEDTESTDSENSIKKKKRRKTSKRSSIKEPPIPPPRLRRKSNQLELDELDTRRDTVKKASEKLSSIKGGISKKKTTKIAKKLYKGCENKLIPVITSITLDSTEICGTETCQSPKMFVEKVVAEEERVVVVKSPPKDGKFTFDNNSKMAEEVEIINSTLQKTDVDNKFETPCLGETQSKILTKSYTESKISKEDEIISLEKQEKPETEPSLEKEQKPKSPAVKKLKTDSGSPIKLKSMEDIGKKSDETTELKSPKLITKKSPVKLKTESAVQKTDETSASNSPKLKEKSPIKLKTESNIKQIDETPISPKFKEKSPVKVKTESALQKKGETPAVNSPKLKEKTPEALKTESDVPKIEETPALKSPKFEEKSPTKLKSTEKVVQKIEETPSASNSSKVKEKSPMKLKSTENAVPKIDEIPALNSPKLEDKKSKVQDTRQAAQEQKSDDSDSSVEWIWPEEEEQAWMKPNLFKKLVESVEKPIERVKTVKRLKKIPEPLKLIDPEIKPTEIKATSSPTVKTKVLGKKEEIPRTPTDKSPIKTALNETEIASKSPVKIKEKTKPPPETKDAIEKVPKFKLETKITEKIPESKKKQPLTLKDASNKKVEETKALNTVKMDLNKKEIEKLTDLKETAEKSANLLVDKTQKSKLDIKNKETNEKVPETIIDSKIKKTAEKVTKVDVEIKESTKKSPQFTKLEEKIEKSPQENIIKKDMIKPELKNKEKSSSQEEQNIPGKKMEIEKDDAQKAAEQSHEASQTNKKKSELDDRLSKINAWLQPKATETKIKISTTTPSQSSPIISSEQKPTVDDKISSINAWLQPTKEPQDKGDTQLDEIKVSESKNTVDEKISKINAFLEPKCDKNITALPKSPNKQETETKTKKIDDKIDKINAWFQPKADLQTLTKPKADLQTLTKPTKNEPQKSPVTPKMKSGGKIEKEVSKQTKKLELEPEPAEIDDIWGENDDENYFNFSESRIAKLQKETEILTEEACKVDKMEEKTDDIDIWGESEDDNFIDLTEKKLFTALNKPDVPEINKINDINVSPKPDIKPEVKKINKITALFEKRETKSPQPEIKKTKVEIIKKNIPKELSPKREEVKIEETCPKKLKESAQKVVDDKISKINALAPKESELKSKDPSPKLDEKKDVEKNIGVDEIKKAEEIKKAALDDKLSRINAWLQPKKEEAPKKVELKKEEPKKEEVKEEEEAKIEIPPPPAPEKKEEIKIEEIKKKNAEMDEKINKINAWLQPKEKEKPVKEKSPIKETVVATAKQAELDDKLSKINAWLRPKEPELSKSTVETSKSIAQPSKLELEASKSILEPPKSPKEEIKTEQSKPEPSKIELDDKISRINAWLAPKIKPLDPQIIQPNKEEDKPESIAFTISESEVKSQQQQQTEIDDKVSKINAWLSQQQTKVSVAPSSSSDGINNRETRESKAINEEEVNKVEKTTCGITRDSGTVKARRATVKLNTKVVKEKVEKCTEPPSKVEESIPKKEVPTEKEVKSEKVIEEPPNKTGAKKKSPAKKVESENKNPEIKKSDSPKIIPKKVSPLKKEVITKEGSPVKKETEKKSSPAKKELEKQASPAKKTTETKEPSPTVSDKKEPIKKRSPGKPAPKIAPNKKDAKPVPKKQPHPKPANKFPAPPKPLFMNPLIANLQAALFNKNQPIRRFLPPKVVPDPPPPPPPKEVTPPPEMNREERASMRKMIFIPDRVSTTRHLALKSSPSQQSLHQDDDSDSDTETETGSSGSSSSGSDTETEEGQQQNKPDRTSTSSEDSGFGSTHTSPITNKNECSVNCHRKCEKHMPNLCGVNQKLLAEALSSLKKGPRASAAEREGISPSHPARRLSTSLSSDSESGEEGGGARRYTPPARTIPRFRKYAVEDFQFLKVLGKGSFGKVLLAELRGTDCYYAVKCLKKDVVLEDDDVECTLIERKVLALGTRHPYLCHLFCTFQTESHLFFVMEYLNGGDLMFHIQQSGRFEQPRAVFYAAEIVSGLKFLHKKGIVYRDLKLDNILLDYEGHVRIADFGMCKLQIYLDRTADTFCGTPDYMAPEIIKGLHYNQCVDWWSFGVLLYEMLIGQSPFNGCDEDELFWSICNEQPYYPRFLSKEAQTILQLLLEKDSSRRLGTPDCPAGDVYMQPFFKAIDWQALDRKELDPPFKPRVLHALDVQYFDSAFTQEAARLTPVDKEILQSMDQSQFHGFSYTNPNACNE